MIATGIPIPTASKRREPEAAIAQQLADGRRSDASPDWHARSPGYPSHSSLLGFGDFGAETVEKRAVRFERRMPRRAARARSRRPRAAGPRARRPAPRSRSARGRARRRRRRRSRGARRPGGSPAAGSAAGSRRWPSSYASSASRYLPGQKQRVAEVVVAEDERRVDLDHAAERRLRLVEPSQLAADDADVVENGEAARIVRERLAERLRAPPPVRRARRASRRDC